MEGLGGIQSAAAIIDCIRFCHKAYRNISNFIHTLKEMGHNVAELQQRFKEEECRMWTFALARNLVVDEDHPVDSLATSLPQFWVEVVDTRLSIVRTHIEEAEALVNKYIGKTPTAPTSATSGSTAEYESAQRNDVPRYNLERRPTDSPSVLLAQTSFENHSTALQKSSFRMKFKWSFQDRKVLEKTIGNLAKDNDMLWKLIEPNQMNTMTDAVSSKISPSDLAFISARAAAGGEIGENDIVRQEYERRIQEQVHAREFIAALESETISQKMRRSLDISLFPEIHQTQLRDNRTRTLTTYRKMDETEIEVLVEWKEWNPNLITRNEVVTRVSDIIAILSSPPRCLNNILSSPGFFEDSRGNSRGTRWIGIVYDTTPLGTQPKIRTLRDLLTRPKEKHRETWKPPLGDRFRLAHRLAENLLAVHNCGWLHKGIRPENIAFFSVSKTVHDPYLLGWDASRSSKRGQKTEPVVSWHKDADLYQHPLWFEELPPSEADDNDNGDEDNENTAARFRIEFDHYQLGCVLLEIGLWCLIGDMKQATRETFSSGPEWRDEWKGYLEAKTRLLEVQMGKIYAEVVLNLLRGLSGDGAGAGRDLEYWDAVVRQLGKCTA